MCGIEECKEKNGERGRITQEPNRTFAQFHARTVFENVNSACVRVAIYAYVHGQHWAWMRNSNALQNVNTENVFDLEITSKT